MSLVNLGGQWVRDTLLFGTCLFMIIIYKKKIQRTTFMSCLLHGVTPPPPRHTHTHSLTFNDIFFDSLCGRQAHLLRENLSGCTRWLRHIFLHDCMIGQWKLPRTITFLDNSILAIIFSQVRCTGPDPWSRHFRNIGNFYSYRSDLIIHKNISSGLMLTVLVCEDCIHYIAPDTCSDRQCLAFSST